MTSNGSALACCMQKNGTENYEFSGAMLLNQKGGWTPAEFGRDIIFESLDNE